MGVADRETPALRPQQASPAKRFSAMRGATAFARSFVLVALLTGGVIVSWTPMPAGGAGVPSGPAPIVSTPKPSPSPTATSTPPFGALHAPLLHAAHIYVSEGSYVLDKSYIGGPIDCGTAPAKWGGAMKANLRAGYTSEKAYIQEKDAFASPVLIGFVPETTGPSLHQLHRQRRPLRRRQSGVRVLHHRAPQPRRRADLRHLHQRHAGQRRGRRFE